MRKELIKQAQVARAERARRGREVEEYQARVIEAKFEQERAKYEKDKSLRLMAYRLLELDQEEVDALEWFHGGIFWAGLGNPSIHLKSVFDHIRAFQEGIQLRPNRESLEDWLRNHAFPGEEFLRFLDDVTKLTEFYRKERRAEKTLSIVLWPIKWMTLWPFFLLLLAVLVLLALEYFG